MATTSLPTFDELPKFHEFTGCAWDVWPANDQLGTINHLTDDVVKQAAQEEIKYVLSDFSQTCSLISFYRTGVTVSLNWLVLSQLMYP
jgi:hypothetical protein